MFFYLKIFIFSIIIIPIIIYFFKNIISISLLPSNYTQNIISTPISPSNINRKLWISVLPNRSKYSKPPIKSINPEWNDV